MNLTFYKVDHEKLSQVSNPVRTCYVIIFERHVACSHVDTKTNKQLYTVRQLNIECNFIRIQMIMWE